MKIRLTAIETVLTKDAEERLDSLENTQDLDYDSLGIAPPKEEELNLTEADYEEVYADCEIDAKKITVIVDHGEKKGCTLYLKDAIKVTVKETLEEIVKKRKNILQRILGL